MVTSSVGRKTLLLGLLVAALVATASCAATSGLSAEASVTISNPARVVVSVLVGDKDVKVATDEMTTVVKLDHPEQDIQIQTAEGRATQLLHVQDGDVLVLYPDPEDPRNWTVQVLSATSEVLKTPEASPRP